VRLGLPLQPPVRIAATAHHEGLDSLRFWHAGSLAGACGGLTPDLIPDHSRLLHTPAAHSGIRALTAAAGDLE